MAEYTEEQIRELEDALINMLMPVHGKLQMYELTGKMSKEDAKKMAKRLEDIVHWIRDRRPKHKRYKHSISV